MMGTLLYDITERCNLRCKHCYNSDYFDKLDHLSSTAYVSDFVHRNRHFVSRVHILGGEPLTSKELWSFIDSLPSTVVSSINTNGTLLNMSNIKRIFERNIDQITISLDGHNEKTNSMVRGAGVFDIVCDNVQHLSEYRSKMESNLKINLAFVVTPKSLDSIEYLASLASKNGFDTVLVSFLHIAGNATTNYTVDYDIDLLLDCFMRLLDDAIKKSIKVIIDSKPIFTKLLEIISGHEIYSQHNNHFGCRAGLDVIYASSEGELYPCGPFSKKSNKSFAGISEIVSFMKSFRKKINEDNTTLLSPLCRDCHYQNICEPCRVDILCGAESLCHNSTKYLYRIIDDIGNKKIDSHSHLKIISRDKKTYLIDFRNLDTIKISNNDICTINIFEKQLHDLKDEFNNKNEYLDFMFNIILQIRKGNIGIS